MKTNIALIGFMGVGKTTVGKALAFKLGKKFVRIDDQIVKLAEKSILEIFQQDGEKRFRELEIEIVNRISEEENIVIDCGGGVILNKVNVDRLKKNSKIILLTAPPEIIFTRISNENEERPLLDTANKLERIKELSALRESLYKESADFEIDTSNLSVDEVVNEILKLLKGCK